MQPSVGEKQAAGFVFHGLTALPIGIGLIVVAFGMLALPAYVDGVSFRVGVALLLGVTAVAGGFARRRPARDSEGSSAAATGAKTSGIIGGVLIVASGFVGNYLGFPLFEIIVGLLVIWHGRQHGLHVILGSIYIVSSPFVWMLAPRGTIGAVSFGLLGLICVVGSVYEHRLITRASHA